MGIEILVSLLAATLSMVAGGIASSEVIQKLLRRVLKLPVQEKGYGERLSELTESLTKASRQVDQVLSELATVAKEREKNVRELEANMQLLEKRENDMKTRIEHLEKVPLPAVEHFAEIMNRGEKRSAIRDYMLFGAGVVVSTVIAIGLKAFGLG
jgi:predicted RNase H-like nuclease (RuvC/YqgF family)